MVDRFGLYDDIAGVRLRKEPKGEYVSFEDFAELKACAEKAEADLRRLDTFEMMDRLGVSRAFERYSAALGWGLTPYQPECWALLDDAVAELARVRAAGTFNQGIEAGIIAGWNACRRSVYAVCEDIGTEADRNRSDTGNPPRHHFGRGEGDAAKRIARAFNSMEARDDDNTTEALRSLRREGGS